MGKINTSVRDVIGMGIVAGMRAMMPAALLSHHFSNHRSGPLKRSRLGFIQTDRAAKITKLLSTAELVGDKLPNAPDRIVFPQLMARMVSGAFAGAVLYTVDKKDIIKGGLIGGATAFAATFAFYYLRKEISKAPKINSSVVGAFEDSLALTTGSCVIASRK